MRDSPAVKGINLPEIVVVGSQSSGKSSVLESIVGRDFLPRGSGMVTKRPLILQLVNLPPTETKEWGEFNHKPGRIYTDFEEIRREIDAETVRLTGAKKTIHVVAIRLKIFSPHVVDLTLVDLPGLTKIATQNQEKDVSTTIYKMVRKYIEKPTTIILAVTPANVDIATSDALSIARATEARSVHSARSGRPPKRVARSPPKRAEPQALAWLDEIKLGIEQSERVIQTTIKTHPKYTDDFESARGG